MAEWPCCHDPLRFSPLSLRFVPPPTNTPSIFLSGNAKEASAFLLLPDFAKAFEVHTDASDFAVGGVLMHEGRPVAYESRKLNDTERKYTVQEKEMTAIAHCLRAWRHYLLGSLDLRSRRTM